MTQTLKKAVGIDLGTTFSVVASLDRDGKPFTIANEEGNLSTPSVVYFDAGCAVVGEEAVNASEFSPERTAQFAKRYMGNDFLNKKIQGKSFPPEVVMALVLQKLKSDAELKIGQFTDAVITVPAYFNEPRRKATQDAGRMAGINVLDIVNEPTAAAIAFGVKEGFVDEDGKATSKERVLVYDLGGGTFDVTLMDIHGSNFDAIATAGDVHLGGMDWDTRIMNSFAEQFVKEHHVDPRDSKSNSMKLMQLAARAKKTLSARDEATVRYTQDGKQSSLKITRGEFESLTQDLVERTRLTVSRLLRDSNSQWKDITRLLLVGGSTRMPMIHRMLEAESGLSCDRSLSPDEAVAHGAAVYAQTKINSGNSTVTISNVNSHDLGVLGRDTTTKKRVRQLMIAKNTKLPKTTRKKFVTSKDGQKEVVVTVVEGGTDSGEGGTKIGKCRVSGIPDDLKKGSDVYVTFQYSADGRLAVSANIPSINVKAKTEIQRSSGMAEADIDFWQSKIAAGIKIDSDDLPDQQQDEVVPAAKVILDDAGDDSVAEVLEGVALAVDLVEDTPTPTAQPVAVPVVEDVAKVVVDEKVEIASDEALEPLVLESSIDLDTGNQPIAKVEESRIIIDNEQESKPKTSQDSALDDFFNNMK